jgi:hypothetical protein
MKVFMVPKDMHWVCDFEADLDTYALCSAITLA